MRNRNEIVCYCSGIGKQQIVEAIGNGANTLQKIRDVTSACTKGNCVNMNPKKRCCSKDIIRLIDSIPNLITLFVVVLFNLQIATAQRILTYDEYIRCDGRVSSLPSPTRTGYNFNGWFTAAT
jgi:hypothetical protein